MARLALLIASIAAAFALFYAGARTPDPLPATAPANVFSAGRALVDIAHIAPQPHPIGSEANHRTRDYLIQRMTALGLSPQVQHTQSHQTETTRDGTTYGAGATVENIIGLLPGRFHDKPALALMAHYDSVPGSPGAADDAAGVSTALEIVRAIKARGVPARDVMLVITDGEEAGLLGAHAFYDQHPLASHVGFIINMETRGGGGRAQMFETARFNGGAIDLYRRTAASPVSNSLTIFIYKNMPNDTDLTVSNAKDIAGLNYAFIGRQFDYHSPTSTLANLDKGSIQHMGGQILPTAMALAFSETLPARTPDVVYGDLPGGLLIAYPPWVGWLVLLAAAALTAAGAARARAAKALSWRDLWQGIGAGVLLLLGGALILHLTRVATGVGFGWIEGRALLTRFPLFEVAMLASSLALALFVPAAMARGKGRAVIAAAFLAVGIAVAVIGKFQMIPMIEGLGGGVVCAILAFVVFSRGATVAGAWTGMLVAGLGVALALQIAAPTAALVVAWPVTAAALMAAITAAGVRRGAMEQGLSLVIAVVAQAFIGEFLHGLMQGPDLPELPALTLWLGAIVLWPLAWPARPEPLRAMAPAAVCLVIGLGIAAFLALTSPWSARYPQAAAPLYVVDHDSGRAWRASAEAPDAWTKAVLTADGGAISRRGFPTFRRPLFAAPAAAVAVQPPGLTTSTAADGTVTISLQMAAGTGEVAVALRPNTFVSAPAINGRSTGILTAPGKWTRIRWSRSAEPLTISFKPAGHGAADLEYAASLDGWPPSAKPLPPMPPTVMGFGDAGDTVVVGTQKAKW